MHPPPPPPGMYALARHYKKNALKIEYGGIFVASHFHLNYKSLHQHQKVGKILRNLVFQSKIFLLVTDPNNY